MKDRAKWEKKEEKGGKESRKDIKFLRKAWL